MLALMCVWAKIMEYKTTYTRLVDDIFKYFVLKEIMFFIEGNYDILIQISVLFASDCPFDNKSALFIVMDGHRMGDKPLADTVIRKFNHAYIKSQTPMGCVMWCSTVKIHQDYLPG